MIIFTLNRIGYSLNFPETYVFAAGYLKLLESSRNSSWPLAKSSLWFQNLIQQ